MARAYKPLEYNREQRKFALDPTRGGFRRIADPQVPSITNTRKLLRLRSRTRMKIVRRNNNAISLDDIID
ncbi:MAG: hypothetical protein E2O36_04475 [Proteobacteria bacterium]|nr:MAG: hypothetical protein E2O36_04475 [Pseudomonadota bacterium]